MKNKDDKLIETLATLVDGVKPLVEISDIPVEARVLWRKNWLSTAEEALNEYLERKAEDEIS